MVSCILVLRDATSLRLVGTQIKGIRLLVSSIFSKEERAGFYRLDDAKSIKAGSIRGPVSKWTISGTVLCGKYSSINGAFNARGRVGIGKYCAFGQYVSLISGNHRTDLPNQQIWLHQRFGFLPPVESKGDIEIGHNVWIGDKANVLSGVKVGTEASLLRGLQSVNLLDLLRLLLDLPHASLKNGSLKMS